MAKGTFEVPKIHKWSDQIERTLTEWAHDYVQTWYRVKSIDKLTGKQIDEIEAYLVAHDTNGWDNAMNVGFRNIVNDWESNNT